MQASLLLAEPKLHQFQVLELRLEHLPLRSRTSLVQQPFLEHRLVHLQKCILRAVYINQRRYYVSLLPLGRYEEVPHVLLQGQRLPLLSRCLILIRRYVALVVALIELFLAPCLLIVLAPQRYPNVCLTQLFIEVGVVGEDALDDAAERVLPFPQVLLDWLRYNF